MRRTFLEAMPLLFFGALLCVIVALAGYIYTTRAVAITYDGPFVITQAEVIEYDKHGMCKYTIAQDEGGDEFDVKFRYVARCDKHHVWDRLALNQGRK